MPIAINATAQAVLFGLSHPPRKQAIIIGNTIPPAPITPMFAKLENEAKSPLWLPFLVDTGTSVLFAVLYKGYAIE